MHDTVIREDDELESGFRTKKWHVEAHMRYANLASLDGERGRRRVDHFSGFICDGPSVPGASASASASVRAPKLLLNTEASETTPVATATRNVYYYRNIDHSVAVEARFNPPIPGVSV